MNRETIMTALFAKLTGPPLVFAFTADTTTGSTALANVSDTSGLMVGMPVAGDGVPADATIATISPSVTLSLPAVADRTATPLLQGFQTTQRRLRDPNAEQDMPALYLLELSEQHPFRSSTAGYQIELTAEAWIYTKIAATENAIPAATLNTLIDGIEAALGSRTHFRNNLGLNGVTYARIEGELQKDPGHTAQIAMAVVPLKIVVAPHIDTFPL